MILSALSSGVGLGFSVWAAQQNAANTNRRFEETNLLTRDLFILSAKGARKKEPQIKKLRLYSTVSVILASSAIVVGGRGNFRYDFAVFDVDNEL